MPKHNSAQKRAPISLLDRFSERPLSEVAESTLNRGEMPELDLEAAIFRDICWLLHTTALASTQDLSRWPQVQKSVLNFGVLALAGKTSLQSSVTLIEKSLQRAIQMYEPRLRRESVQVRAIVDPRWQNQRTLPISISGEYSDGNSPNLFEIRALLDLETGRLEVQS
ncbi:MAG: type VI secretion system baseplate subunit TssE [Pirellulales bacterium]